jgi:hypothetical protein
LYASKEAARRTHRDPYAAVMYPIFFLRTKI